jgi:hypothetical protein
VSAFVNSRSCPDFAVTCIKQPGFVDALGLSSDTEHDQFVGITVWRSKVDSDRYMSSQGQQILASFKPLLQSEPTYRTFNVEASVAHNLGVSRAAGSSR